MDVCRFENFVLRCPTPRLHCFLSSHRPSFRFLSFMAFLIPSILFFSVFLMLSFVSASTSMLFWVIFLLPFLSYICNWDKCLSRSTRSLLSCGRRWKTPVISSSQRTRLATSATAERDTSWQFIGMARQGWSSTWTWQTSQTHKKPGIFKMTLFFPTQVWDEKKMKIHFPVSPEPRVKWGTSDKTKHGLYFIFLTGVFFFVDDILSGWGQSSCQQTRSFHSFTASNKEDRWWNSELNRGYFQKIWSELWTHCIVVHYVFLLGSISLIFRVWKAFLLSKEQIFFYSLSDTLWKISFCKFLCMTLTWILSNPP